MMDQDYGYPDTVPTTPAELAHASQYDEVSSMSGLVVAILLGVVMVLMLALAWHLAARLTQ